MTAGRCCHLSRRVILGFGTGTMLYFSIFLYMPLLTKHNAPLYHDRHEPLKIDSNIPLPSFATRKSLGELPLHEMQVGDSILVSTDAEGDLRRLDRALRMRLWRFVQGHPNFKFSCRRVPASTTGDQDIRVWRVPTE